MRSTDASILKESTKKILGKENCKPVEKKPNKQQQLRRLVIRDWSSLQANQISSVAAKPVSRNAKLCIDAAGNS